MSNKPHAGLLLRLIAIFKVVKAVVLVASLATMFHLIHRDDPVHTLVTWALRLHVDPDAHYLRDILAALLDLDATHLALVAGGIGLYATVFLVEGIGLWFDQLWAEYLTVAATGGFIPVEIYEVVKQVHVNRVALLAVNVAIVSYLVRYLRRPRPDAPRTPLSQPRAPG